MRDADKFGQKCPYSDIKSKPACYSTAPTSAPTTANKMNKTLLDTDVRAHRPPRECFSIQSLCCGGGASLFRTWNLINLGPISKLQPL